MKSHILIILAILSLSIAWEYNNPYRMPQATAQQQQWIDQDIDHFDYSTSATFKQRYYILDDFYNHKNGPVYLYICGEAECRGVSNTSWVASLANQTGGLILSLEHRFYGKSMPFGNDSMSLENLRFLNVEQGLSDLAYFVKYIKTHQLHGVTDKNPWIAVGGSYAGAMSAWFRVKYPHLTVGALSSSGVVDAVELFQQFDQQIYQSALKSGKACVDALQDLEKYVEDIIKSDERLNFQAQFKAEKLTATQFLFYWADVMVFQFQYSKRVEFCLQISGKSREQVFAVVKSIALTVSPVDYGAFYLGNATFAIQDGRGARAWIYQSCTQLSYFQTPTIPQHRMRSTDLNEQFYRAWCANIFGKGVWPDTSRANWEFGAQKLEATNLYMSNGDEDPWRWASLQTSRKNVISKVYHCPNCGHCVDLHTPIFNDPPELKVVRAEQLSHVKAWISSATTKKNFIIL